MRFDSKSILFMLLLFAVNCKKSENSNHDSRLANQTEAQHFLINGSGNKVATGVPVKIQGKRIELSQESEPKPLKVEKKTEATPVKQNHRLATAPAIVQILGTKKAFPFYKKGIVPATNGGKQAISYPKAVKALAAHIKNSASRDIHYWSINQNMNSSSIWTMIQDSRGDFWFGTMGGGAIRFNGVQFETFTEKEGLPGNHIFALLEDRKGNIWFGTRNKGISRFDGTHFTHFDTENGLPHNFVLCMLEDSKGNLWFGTRGGLSRFDGTYFTTFSEEDGLAHNEIISLFEDSNHHLWIGTGEGTGIQRFDGDSLTHYNVGEGKGKNDVHAIMEDHQGNLWFGTWGGGAIMYDGIRFLRFASEHGLGNENVLSILEDEAGSIWFGTLGGGVSLYDGNSFTHYTTDEGLSSNNVRYLWKGDQHNIWVCTWDKGVNRINKKGVHTFKIRGGKEAKEIQSISMDRKGNLWLGTNIGLSKFDGENFTHIQSKESIIQNGVITVFVDDKQNYWLGAGGGVSQYNGIGIKDFTREYGLLAGDVRAIHQDRNGHIWFGTYAGGIIRYDGKSFLQFSEKEGYISDDVYTIYEDHEGFLWFGTLGGGVSRFDGSDFIHYTTNEGLSHDYVLSILGDAHGNIWIGTEDGLNKFADSSFTQFTTKEGLIHNTIYALSLDVDKNLWIKSPKGISVRLKEEEKVHFVNLGKEDGLNESNLSNRSFIIDQENQLWIEAEQGLKMLDLNHFKSPSKPPKNVRLSNLEINQSFIDYPKFLWESGESNVDLEFDFHGHFDSLFPFHNLPKNLHLPYHLNHLSFHFSAIDWLAPEKIQYQYKLEGIDENWSIPQSEAKANYRNLPHGKFTFWLKAKGRADIWSEPISYTFRISPPWWRSWGAYIAYFFIISFTGFQVYRLLLSRRLAIEEGKRIKEISELKSSIYTDVTHEFRTPLTVINGMVEELESANQAEVVQKTSVIRTHSKKLLKLVNQLLQLSRLESHHEELNSQQGDIIGFIRYLVSSHQIMASSQGISLDYLSKEEQLSMDFDPQKLETVLTNLISNAIKFTPEGGKVQVHTQEIYASNRSTLEIKLVDTGMGIAEDELPHIFNRFHRVGSDNRYPGTGIGLALVKELVSVMGGEISVSSKLQEGTTFSIHLPIQHNSSSITETLYVNEKSSASLEASISGDEHQPIPDHDKPVVLIIEDSPDIIQYLTNSLADTYQVMISQDGKEGLSLAFEKLPDIIITDVKMPGMNGFQLCERIKEEDRTNHIPIIILTAKASMNDKLEGLSKGADAYIIKPFDRQEVLIRLEKLLALRETLQKKYLEELQSRYELNPIEKKSRNTFIDKVEEEILAKLSNEDFSVNELADKLCLSRSQLNRKIKASTGMSTSLFLRHIRLLEARKLLKSSDLSVSEVLYQVGFNSPAYFSQAYKNQFGINPSDERKSR